MNDPVDHGAAPQFLDLWPTQLMRIHLPDADAANSVLASLIMERNAGLEDMTVDYTSKDLIASGHPAVQWLHHCCNREILDYAARAGIDYELDWTVQGWGNTNFRRDYHNLHNHPHSWLSATYYVNVPDQSDAETYRSDLNPSASSFFDQRGQTNMNAIRGDRQVDPEYRILPTGGDLLLWPAFLHHLVHPNMAKVLRIAVSFNVVLKWKAEYMPH